MLFKYVIWDKIRPTDNHRLKEMRKQKLGHNTKIRKQKDGRFELVIFTEREIDIDVTNFNYIKKILPSNQEINQNKNEKNLIVSKNNHQNNNNNNNPFIPSANNINSFFPFINPAFVHNQNNNNQMVPFLGNQNINNHQINYHQNINHPQNIHPFINPSFINRAFIPSFMIPPPIKKRKLNELNQLNVTINYHITNGIFFLSL